MSRSINLLNLSVIKVPAHLNHLETIALSQLQPEIRFNQPPVVGTELGYISTAMVSGRLAGDNHFSLACQDWFNSVLDCNGSLLTPSCTHALEMTALLLDIGPDDEVIMPSYTFVSTANAYILRGAKVVFVDIRPDTMNIDEQAIEAAITPRTRLIVPVHYAGVVCEMDVIMGIAERHKLAVVEDAAQAVASTWKGRPAGSIGDMSAFSFHETKNVTAGGEGGLLAVNRGKYLEAAEILREKGTNRSQFFRGHIDKYTWVNRGSSYLPAEIQAAYLFAQLEALDSIQTARMALWNRYQEALQPYAKSGRLELPYIPKHCEHNAHMFYIKVADLTDRSRVLDTLNKAGIRAVFHYVPLHSSPFGRSHTRFQGEDIYTTRESDRLIRLPLWFGMTEDDQSRVLDQLKVAL